ncbi:MAG: phosphonate transporter, periplasmic phosphonate-binding protein [candidate division NC10 bacterium]|nr:phosphonate transporter, periplasmic phosphonate-binding protein [candidate division NC10 bacterium]MBS1116775.1 phosphonate transporter, periplasmic phosphonate-binding protein [candidate division NC10 bacterium]
MRTWMRIWVLTALLLSVSGAAVATAAEPPKQLVMAITPSNIPTELFKGGEVFAAELAKKVGIPIKVYMPTDYLGVVEALRNRTADMAFVHPAGYVFANREAKAQIVAVDVWHGKTSYTSRFYVRKDSGISSLEGLRGKTIAFVDPGSTSGYVYPMVTLIKKGLVTNRDPKTFFKEAMFAGTHEAALLALLNGSVDAVASFDLAPQQYLKEKEKVERISHVAETEPIPEAGMCVREGLDPSLVKKITESLMAFNAPEYRPVLKDFYGIDGFAPAKDSDYNPVREAIDLLGWRPKR